jgi:hypothetical protein
MRTFLLYSDFVHMNLRRKQEHLNRLPIDYSNRLPAVTFDKIAHLNECMELNQTFFTDMIAFQDYNFSERHGELPDKYCGKKIPYSEMHRYSAPR